MATFLGFGVLIASVWAVFTAFLTLPDDVSRALTIFALAPAGCIVARPFSGTQATGRDPLHKYVRDVMWLAGPLLLGTLYAT